MNFNHPMNGFRPIGKISETPIPYGYRVSSPQADRSLYFEEREYAQGYANSKVRDGSWKSATVYTSGGTAVGGAGSLFE